MLASGARTASRRSEPPASINSTVDDDSEANLPATAHPAEPAPTTMKSYAATGHLLPMYPREELTLLH
jgi:hypothetical protein